MWTDLKLHLAFLSLAAVLRHVTSADSKTEVCGGEWKHPAGCSSDNGDCSYEAHWEFLEDSDEIRFTVRTNYANKWVGIAFSETNGMPGTDAVLGWASADGKSFIGDMWVDSYSGASLDGVQDIRNASVSVTNGRTTMSFIRTRSTGDKREDSEFSDTSCLFMKYPHSGGFYRVVGSRTMFFPHSQTPIVTKERVCIRSCTKDWEAKTTFTKTTSSVPKSIFNIELSLKSRTDDEAPERNTPEFQDLAKRLRDGLLDNLGKVAHVDDLVLLGVDKGEDHMIARLELYMDSNDDSELTDSLDQAVKDSIAAGNFGDIEIDSERVEVKSSVVDGQVDDGNFDYSMLFS